MKATNKLTILNDPIYGFITIPNTFIFDLIQHRYFQRLRRISQMGLSYLVYPGAHHTRFQHALGCLHLMQKAITVLHYKGINITEEEKEALLIAILLHDIGHGPFSHAMEHSIVEGIHHEDMSLLFMKKLNQEFSGRLSMAIAIFKGDYSMTFMNQLVSGQLDIDRMDYLKRDSFYTGVSEGNINSERIITMLNVTEDDKLAIEEKGVYSIEKFLVARRLMYWQVYLHKTSLVAEQLMIRVFKRAKELLLEGKDLYASDALLFFMKNQLSKKDFDTKYLDLFSKLDDYDVVSAMKAWQRSDDYVLSTLCTMLINRTLLKIKLKNKPISIDKLEKHRKRFAKTHKISEHEANYFVFSGGIENQAYDTKKHNINILLENKKTIDVAIASDQLNILALSKPVKKYYICYPKDQH
ncbi:HD domain-containing protein [Leptobacterium sp. I13]|uniref:HD domain-containing protein n=1 Tax=Leptobacterium meishanense TaxID=3128904 RepID=UPI0030EB51FF